MSRAHTHTDAYRNALVIGAAAAVGISALAYMYFRWQETRAIQSEAMLTVKNAAWRAPKNAAVYTHAHAHDDSDGSAAQRSIFEVTVQNGFLPLVHPLRTLPTEFAALESVMSRLPELLHASEPNALADAVAALPEYDLAHMRTDTHTLTYSHTSTDGDAGGAESRSSGCLTPVLLQALMRDYSILVSAYLLEGKAKMAAQPDASPMSPGRSGIRRKVPANIAKPFAWVCEQLGEQMIMSYDSYCLSNCFDVRHDAREAVGFVHDYDAWEWEQLRLVRAFDGGPEEATFILIHSEIESHTPHLIRAYDALIDAATGKDIGGVKTSLVSLKAVLERIIVSQLKMFNASDPRNYERFVRPWIFGWRGNPDFPDGVVFEGVNGDAPTMLRGETGAQSTIVPSLDVVLGITHKEDALRKMLTELEAYRPRPQREFLGKLREIMWGKDIGPDGDRDAVRTFNECVAYVWAFRDIHVTFSEAYIARFSKKEMATGGTPYKAYLRKHRDESLAHQIVELGADLVHRFAVPPLEAFNAEVDAILADSTANGIPKHLLERHAGIISKYGRGAPSLRMKRFPKHGEISTR